MNDLKVFKDDKLKLSEIRTRLPWILCLCSDTKENCEIILQYTLKKLIEQILVLDLEINGEETKCCLNLIGGKQDGSGASKEAKKGGLGNKFCFDCDSDKKDTEAERVDKFIHKDYEMLVGAKKLAESLELDITGLNENFDEFPTFAVLAPLLLFRNVA